jgi:glycosyltransferase involved in cell wall biosynthesis
MMDAPEHERAGQNRGGRVRRALAHPARRSRPSRSSRPGATRGRNYKVLESLAAGLPVVMTSAVRGGLPAGAKDGCATADEPEAFAQAVVALLDLSPDERLGWDAQLSPVRGILEETCRGVRS